MESIIQKLQNKKDLRGISEEVIKNIIKEYSLKNPKKYELLKQKNFNSKSKEYEDFKKYVRKKLRNLHGVFQKNRQSQKQQTSYLLQEDFSFQNPSTQKFLKSHRSTKERLPYYETVYKEIQNETKITKIADLGCGLNPLSFTLLKDLKEAFCVDINEEELNFLQNFFDKIKIKATTQVLDLAQKENHETIKKKTNNTDACFLFKTLDGLEQTKKGASESLIKNIKSEYIVVSFSTKTISGKNAINAERNWFQEILKSFKNKKLTKKKIGEEEYYIIKNK